MNDFIEQSVLSLTKQEILTYTLICSGILYTFTTVIDSRTGHLLAFLVILLALGIMLSLREETIVAFDSDLEYKMKSISDPPPDNFYVDADLITFFYNIKEDFYEYSKDSFDKAVKAADNVLLIRKQMEMNLCAQPIVPNFQNHLEPVMTKDGVPYLKTPSLEIQLDTDCKSTLVNSYEMYQASQEQSKVCLNYLQSMIFNIPISPVTHETHRQMLLRGQLLLKRNVDIIKGIYENHSDLHSHRITDYDTYIPMNKSTGQLWDHQGQIENSFNFY